MIRYVSRNTCSCNYQFNFPVRTGVFLHIVKCITLRISFMGHFTSYPIYGSINLSVFSSCSSLILLIPPEIPSTSVNRHRIFCFIGSTYMFPLSCRVRPNWSILRLSVSDIKVRNYSVYSLFQWFFSYKSNLSLRSKNFYFVLKK